MPDNTPDDIEIPPFARLPMVALFMTVVLSADQSSERLTAGMNKIQELAESGGQLTSQLCKFTLISIARRGPFAMLPSASPSLDDLMTSLTQGYEQLRLAVDNHEIEEAVVRDFMWDVHAVAKAAVYLTPASPLTPQQEQVLAFFERRAKGAGQKESG